MRQHEDLRAASGVLTDEDGLNCAFVRTVDGFELPDGMPENTSYQRIFAAAKKAGMEVHWADGTKFTKSMPAVSAFESLA